ncbi:50S ribosomal protein L19 [candidate division NPL-UPA2 bacterium Unc8]|uniref:50S ribosomal protein L19 n=1 Tax=candidate division NPL-UPA2 bacterium Unc8 TaxID=1980939 RepID=A0A399FY74_UNCN2|nr:50S ribosomal protein L19 [Bacillota bacterium]MBT9139100.1 50S ribosomal protein L19 [Bacillota bacterium]MBT9148297.1 50S ribosomal protein L19 [Bacillota bacterium]RII01067.1 MAG: 50S ribosomal protein L19 [candidate division NPL-UPA2 bacterium Unc8]
MKNVKESFRVGDIVRIKTTVVEGDKKRAQTFEGIVIRLRGRGLSETFTTRRISYGTGVERIFPLHSPLLESIKVVESKKVRQGRPYYLRDLSGKAARLKHRQPGKKDEGSGRGKKKTAKNVDE